jgi:predicted GNAT superfamily acetyltransferase
VAERLEGAHPESSLKAYLDRGAVLLNEAEAGTGRLRDCFPPSLPPKVDLIAVEIPADIQSMKTTDLQQARRWRASTREIFESAFGAGFTVVDFVSEVKDGERRNFYLLRRGFEVDR